MQSVARYARRRRAVVPRSGATKTRWHVLRARATLWREGLAGLATDLENAVYFGVAHINAAGMAIIAATPFAIGSPPVALAATREEVSRCRAVRNNIERRDCFEALKEGSKAKADEAAKAKTGNAPSPPAPDAPATTSAIDHLSVTPGQPLCVDRDALAAMLAAGVLASSPAEATTNGCQAIPEGAKVELLERYPSGLRFLRVLAV